MKTTIMTFILMGIALLLAGCAATTTRPVTGTIGFNRNPVGTSAPGIPIVTRDGRQETFSEIRKPIAIVAFTEPGNSGGVFPELATLAKRLQNAPITVAQIELPTGHTYQSTPSNETGVVLLTDNQGIVWNGFHEPQANTVFVIDQHGKIRLVGSLDQLDTAVREAKALGRAAEKEYRQMYAGEEGLW